eukprot:scaffold4517_cov170-Alexandrium_tamarense.AAC.5
MVDAIHIIVKVKVYELVRSGTTLSRFTCASPPSQQLRHLLNTFAGTSPPSQDLNDCLAQIIILSFWGYPAIIACVKQRSSWCMCHSERWERQQNQSLGGEGAPG